jgi:hypothetical protein
MHTDMTSISRAGIELMIPAVDSPVYNIVARIAQKIPFHYFCAIVAAEKACLRSRYLTTAVV